MQSPVGECDVYLVFYLRTFDDLSKVDKKAEFTSSTTCLLYVANQPKLQIARKKQIMSYSFWLVVNCSSSVSQKTDGWRKIPMWFIMFLGLMNQYWLILEKCWKLHVVMIYTTCIGITFKIVLIMHKVTVYCCDKLTVMTAWFIKP